MSNEKDEHYQVQMETATSGEDNRGTDSDQVYSYRRPEQAAERGQVATNK